MCRGYILRTNPLSSGRIIRIDNRSRIETIIQNKSNVYNIITLRRMKLCKLQDISKNINIDIHKKSEKTKKIIKKTKTELINEILTLI